jgi:predicted HicB family RNase H-like nuclease
MHGMIQRKTDHLNMRIDPEVKAAAEEAAIADRRSLSSLVEKLLTDYCREHGFLKQRKAKRS